MFTIPIPQPPLPDPIPLNNSSLEDMGCSRRYVYRVVYGARVPQVPRLRAGKLFHKFMQVISPEDHPLFMTTGGNENAPIAAKYNTDEFKALFRDVAPDTQIRMANLARAVADVLAADLAEGRREYYFDIPTDTKGVHAVGTIDLVNTFDDAGYTTTITDYKTTERPINGDIVMDYALKSQLFFYSAALRLSDGDDTLQYRRRYVIVGYGSRHTSPDINKSILVQQPELIHQHQLEMFAEMIQEKAQIASFLHNNPGLSTKDGMTNGVCKFCAFRQICALNNPEKEADAFARWPLGFEPYNPKGF